VHTEETDIENFIFGRQTSKDDKCVITLPK